MNEPALTAEEWGEFGWDLEDHPQERQSEPYGWKDGETAAVWANASRSILYLDDGCETVRVKGSGQRHGLAALCLHNQPFGFTREDVRYLRACADIVGEVQGGHYHTEEGELHRIADRIEALLPPEDKTNG